MLFETLIHPGPDLRSFGLACHPGLACWDVFSVLSRSVSTEQVPQTRRTGPSSTSQGHLGFSSGDMSLGSDRQGHRLASRHLQHPAESIGHSLHSA